MKKLTKLLNNQGQACPYLSRQMMSLLLLLLTIIAGSNKVWAESSACEITNVTAGVAEDQKYESSFDEATKTYTVLIPFEDRGIVSGETDYYDFAYTLSAGANVNDANKRKSCPTTAGGKNTLTLVVTAEDGVTQKTWKLVLERGAAPIVAHTVSFDVDGKGGAVANMQESAPEAGITLPQVTPIPDHTFLGWDSNNDGTADLFAGDPYKPSADITLKAIYRAESATVGAANSQWWTNFSKFCQLNKDNSIGFTFTNNGGNDNTYENWVMIVTNNAEGHALDGNSNVGSNELYLLRPDGNAWGNGATGRTSQLYKEDGTGQYRQEKVDGGSAEAKAAFINAMKNATVDLRISYEDKYIYTIAKITSANGNYILVDKSGNIGSAENVWISFTTEKSYITFTGQKTNQLSVKVTTAHTGEGSTAAKIAPGIQLFSDRPIANGTEVVFQATPATGYTLVNWTDAESNEVSTQTDFTKAIEANVTYTANFAANYSYTVNAVDGSSNVLKEIKVGNVIAGSNVTVHYPKYILNEGTMYEIAQNGSHPDYGVTFTPDADNYVKEITYTASALENVVYYTEAEDLKSYTTCDQGVSNQVASNGKVARGTNNNVTTLAPGKYKIWAKGFSTASRTTTFTVGETSVFAFEFNGMYVEGTSEEFTVNTSSVLKVATSGTRSDGLDCFYIIRTGDAVTYNVTQATSTGGSIKSSVSLTQPVPAGTNVTFTATANDWYQVDNWYDEATNPATKLADAVNTCNVTVNADMNVKVNFIRYYNVAVTTTAGGTVALKNEAGTEDIADDAPLKRGTKVKAIATPASGYHFVRWEANGVEVSNSQADYQKKVEEYAGANATLITLNAVFEEDAVAVAVPTADLASGSDIYLGDKITLSAEEGATIHYIWASVSDLYATVADMQAESDRLKSSTTNTIQVSTNTVGPRYLYAYAQKGNWTSDVVCFNYTAQFIAVEATVLEVRGAKHTGDAPYYFTNSVNTTDVKFERNDNDYNLDAKVSPLAADQASSAIGVGVPKKVDGDYPITINLNSTSASKIVAAVNGGGASRTISKIEVDDEQVNSWTQTPSSFDNTKPNTTRVEISGLNIAQGSKVTIHFSSSTNVYYFEVYSTSQINAPKIKDNGDKSATITSKTDGATIYYKTYTEKPATIPSKDELISTLTEGKTAKVSSTSYVYAYAEKNGQKSDITEGIINVATTPSLSCRPVAVTLSVDDPKLPKTQPITTVATMNKEVVTSNYTYSYTSDKETVATVNNTGLITAAGAGSAKITITAKSGDDVVATDEVIVVVTDKDMITPEFTWNGTQFDVVVNNKFNDKTPKAYKEVTLNAEQRFVDITTGYNITYFSSNDNASVDKNGVVTGLKIGQATITAVFIAKDEYAGSYNPGIATIIANVKVGGAVPLNVEVSNNPPTIDLSTASLTYQSKTPTLVAAQYTPLSNSEWFATYESDNWNVATVDVNGLVTAHNVGEAHIKVAYMPNQDGPYAEDFNAFVHTYTIRVVDPTRFIITQGYGYDESTGHSTIFPLSTVTDNNKYVTMTFGGWRGVNGTDETYYNSGSKRDEGTEYNGGRDYWGGKGDAGKTDAAGASPDYPYAVTSKSGGNPISETIGKGYNPTNATQFSVPCRGAYLMYEPSVDGVLTVNILQNGVLDAKDFSKASPGRLVYIVDEFGHVVTPTAYGMASDVRNWKIGDKADNGNLLTEAIYKDALSKLGLTESDYTSGTHAPGNVESVIPYNQGYAVLRKGPSFYTFDVKAGKKYYIFGNGTKNGFYGFKFVKSNSFSATDVTISTESGVSKVNDGADLTMNDAIAKYNDKPVVIKEYDRNFTADMWTPLVLPYSMNDIQVKAIFGDGVDILYVDDVQGQTIKMSHHFYKTIVAGKSCLIKPSKAVMSLATTAVEKDGVKYPYVTFSNAGITGYSDYTTGKQETNFTWSPSYDPQNVTGGDYYISTKDGNFTKLADGKNSKLKGCRAFLKKTNPEAEPVALSVKMSSFMDDEDVPTEIEMVIVDENTDEITVVTKDDIIYNLVGQPVNRSSMKSGEVYIVNGKKFVAN